MHKLYSVLLFLLSITVFAQSQKADLIRIMTAPVSDTYEVAINERADFEVSIFKYGKLVKNASITYTIAPEQMDAQITKSIVLKDGQGLLEGIKLSEPGFIRLTVSY
ncbi:MAG: acetylxylan esterase, partial [Nonlabens sp.]|nr:acetylxylan esterase [Nonlabens sp.]